jgi:hypothetical protein
MTAKLEADSHAKTLRLQRIKEGTRLNPRKNLVHVPIILAIIFFLFK